MIRIYRGIYGQDYLYVPYAHRAVVRAGGRWRHWHVRSKSWLVDQLDRAYWEDRVRTSGLPFEIIDGEPPGMMS